jgi:hypothetical protein
MLRRATLVLLLSASLGCPSGGVKVDDTGPEVEDSCPVLHVSGAELAWVDAAASGADPQELIVTNLCDGSASLVLALSMAAGSSDAFAAELDVTELAPGASATLTVSFEPGDFEAHSGTLQLGSNAHEPSQAEVVLSGNAVADADGDGYDSPEAGGDDCDDSDASVYPGADDAWYDGVDSDCAGDSDYDQDGDGHDSDVENGGGDCDDLDASVYPGADDAWYDGVDSDCAGDSDYDQDGDGGDAVEYGGDDCDDLDAAVYFDSGEISQDGADDDCDGLVDEDWVSVGDVIVSEVMANPAGVDDSAGEWFELYNTSGSDIDLVAWTIEADDGDLISIDSSLVVPAAGRVVLGVEIDRSLNGGAPVTYAYDRADLALSDSADSLRLMLGDTEIFGLAWDSGFVQETGASLNLDADAHDASAAILPESWCPSILSFGVGDGGTPGTPNSSCGDYDYDGDGWTGNEGDCDEGDATINPGQAEAWDGIDNDCDGIDDNLDTDSAVAYLYGDDDQNIGYRHSLALGDLTGDGTLDIIAGGYYTESAYYGAGGVYVVDGAPYDGYAGQINDNEVAWIEGGTYYNYTGQMDPIQGDIDGDGIDDLFLSSSDSSYSSNVAGGIFLGGSDLTGSLDLPDDADILFTDSQYRYTVPLSHLDFDADGLCDIFYGDAYYSYYYYSHGGYLYAFMGASLAAGSSYSLADDADFVLEGEDDEDAVGYALGGGDLDADGYDDLLVSAPYADQGSTDTGSVYLYYGAGGAGLPASGLADDVYDVQFYGGGGDEYLGLGTAPQVGDFDGDGSADLAIASYYIDTVYVWLGASALTGVVRATTADITITGAGPSAFGYTLTQGDVDADGIQDLIVGAPDYTSPNSASAYADEPGELYIFAGADLDPTISSSSDASVLISGHSAYDLFGLAAASGDLTGDGTDDLLVASPNLGGDENGFVWIFESP